ncbi:MAG: hypothetical protein JSS20_15490, partial [Proteobacteria bacterium]|nr:hypothetical protein [Pseudomonadota bacterium]
QPAPTGNDVSGWSPWVDGVKDRLWWCDQLKAQLQDRLGRVVGWQVLETDEQSREVFALQVQHRYYCRGRPVPLR